jgi:hypothetical protein
VTPIHATHDHRRLRLVLTSRLLPNPAAAYEKSVATKAAAKYAGIKLREARDNNFRVAAAGEPNAAGTWNDVDALPRGNGAVSLSAYL